MFRDEENKLVGNAAESEEAARDDVETESSGAAPNVAHPVVWIALGAVIGYAFDLVTRVLLSPVLAIAWLDNTIGPDAATFLGVVISIFLLLVFAFAFLHGLLCLGRRRVQAIGAWISGRIAVCVVVLVVLGLALRGVRSLMVTRILRQANSDSFIALSGVLTWIAMIGYPVLLLIVFTKVYRRHSEPDSGWESE